MHYQLEVIMPPTDNVEKALEDILGEYSENYEDEDGTPSKYAFYDYYVVGGRYSGSKLQDELDEKKMEEFYALLKKEKITVSSFVAGKQSLSPPDQIDKVNKLWSDFFPESPIKECPLFDNYKNDYGDILELSKLSKKSTAFRVIIAQPGFDHKESKRSLDAKWEPSFMLAREIWNGVTHQDTLWNGNICKAIRQYKKYLKGTARAYKEISMPKGDWICVTVDYHS